MTRKPRLLIAEDDPAARELVEAAARRSDAFESVHIVEDGQAVLNVLWRTICADEREDLPELILTDLNMPGLNGIELTRDLKAHPETSWIPVAIITSFGSEADRRLAAEAGCSAYFERPPGLADLTELLKQVARLWPVQPNLPAR